MKFWRDDDQNKAGFTIKDFEATDWVEVTDV